jgi:hypothetical protein
MRRQVAFVALMVMFVPATVLAQAASPDTETQLQQDLRHRRVIVKPVTPLSEVNRDLDRVELEALQQQERAAIERKLSQPVQTPPHVDDDFKGGIQTRNLNNLLGR